MGAAAFEIGLFDPRATRATMLTREWDLDTLLKSVRWLRLKNAEGRHIYIRPAGEHSLSLIDDLNAQVIERLKVERFSPAVVLETSPGNFQTWLNHGHVLSERRPHVRLDVWRYVSAGIPGRRTGATMGGWRDLRIARISIAGPMVRSRMYGCTKPTGRCMRLRLRFYWKSRSPYKRKTRARDLRDGEPIPCAARKRKVSRIFGRGQFTRETRLGWTSLMRSMPYLMVFQRTTHESRLPPGTSPIKEARSGSNNMSIAPSQKLGAWFGRKPLVCPLDADLVLSAPVACIS